MLQTDSEHEVLPETDSESEALHEADDEFDSEILLASDCEEVCIEPPHSKKRKYSKRSTDHLLFLQKEVCKHAHARLYGVSARAIQSLREGAAPFTATGEARLKEPKHPNLGVSLARQPENQKWPNILMFFFLLYHSCAEILPTRLVMPRDGKFESHLSKDPDFQERCVGSFMKNLEKNSDINPAP